MSESKSIRRSAGQLRRVAAFDRPTVTFKVDGVRLVARDGDTVLTAILTNRKFLRRFEFGAELRAGFCLMGACQDCWISQHGGPRIRACTTRVVNGMAILTGADE